jgi:hypothetical protein
MVTNILEGWSVSIFMLKLSKNLTMKTCRHYITPDHQYVTRQWGITSQKNQIVNNQRKHHYQLVPEILVLQTPHEKNATKGAASQWWWMSFPRKLLYGNCTYPTNAMLRDIKYTACINTCMIRSVSLWQWIVVCCVKTLCSVLGALSPFCRHLLPPSLRNKMVATGSSDTWRIIHSTEVVIPSAYLKWVIYVICKWSLQRMQHHISQRHSTWKLEKLVLHLFYSISH